MHSNSGVDEPWQQQPATLGVLGAGQLGQMLGLAAIPLGVRCRFLDPAADPPAAAVGAVIRADYDDAPRLDRFAATLTAVTYEFENVPVAAAARLSRRGIVRPGARALETAQDRLTEKRFFTGLGIPTPTFRPIADRAGLEAAVADVGFPAVLKTRRLGYDGRGQRVLRQRSDLDPAWAELGTVPLILEEFIRFDRELSAIAVRSVDGGIRHYPLTENHHHAGILRTSTSIASAHTGATDAVVTARSWIHTAMEALNYVGVLAIELFERDGTLMVNEMAPRVHNSGHLTIEGSATSQFENHVRAVLGLPLGEANEIRPAAMVNIIGTPVDAAAVLAEPIAHLHLYGKSPRPGRKLGHITVADPDRDRVIQARDRMSRLVEAPVAGQPDHGR